MFTDYQDNEKRFAHTMEVYGKRARNQRVAGEVSGRLTGNQGTTKTGPNEHPPLCKVCERTGETSDANTFCVECCDHMCDNCARAHRGSRTSRRHQLLDKSQMPRKAFKARHICDTHPDTPIEYYCKKQDQLLCRHCIALNHHGCQEDDLIINVCGRVEDHNEFRKMYKGLKEIEQKIIQQESKRKSNLVTIDTQQKTTKRDIDNFKKEMYLFVDRLVYQMHEEVDGIVETDKDAMTAVGEECDNVTAEVRDLITEIDIRKQSNEKMQLFIVMKTAQQALEMLGFKMKSIDSQNRSRKYNFMPNKKIRDMMRSVQKLGELSVECEESAQYSAGGRAGKLSEQKLRKMSLEDETSFKSDNYKYFRHPIKQQHFQMTNIEDAFTMAKKSSELAVKGKRDKSDCWISGIESLNDDHLVIADYNNYSVKTLFLIAKGITDQLELPFRPWDITKISKDTLAVTCPDGECIQLVSVSRFGSLSRVQKIQVQGKCHAIQFSDAGGGRMVVSFVGPGKVQVIDMSGTVLKDLSCDLAGTPLFSSPRYASLSPDGACVYVSDWDNHSVTGITLDRRVVLTYTDDKLTDPTGLAVGDDGAIFVCGGGSHNIHMVSIEGRKIAAVLGEEDGVKGPYGIMYNSTNRTFYVGMVDNNNVLMYDNAHAMCLLS